jgi:hypothetical protein
MTKTIYFILGFFAAAGLWAWSDHPTSDIGIKINGAYNSVTYSNGKIHVTESSYWPQHKGDIFIDSDDEGTCLAIIRNGYLITCPQ